MNTATANDVSNRLFAAIDAAVKNDPELKKYDVARIRETLGYGLTLKISVTPKMTIDTIKSMSDDDVKQGFARPGTPITYHSRNGLGRGTIIATRRIKYLFRDEKDGREYTINFRACSLDAFRLKQNVEADA